MIFCEKIEKIKLEIYFCVTAIQRGVSAFLYACIRGQTIKTFKISGLLSDLKINKFYDIT